tara:strand:- start:62 stop:373 length:312 start_codon:yes stop_codon:yes gene_type:complete
MIERIKKLFGITTPTVVDSKPKHKYAGNAQDRRRARRAWEDKMKIRDEKRAVESSPHTSVNEANEMIKFLQNEIDEAMMERYGIILEQREFCDYPTPIERSKS